jgi:hypothetical protein
LTATGKPLANPCLIPVNLYRPPAFPVHDNPIKYMLLLLGSAGLVPEPVVTRELALFRHEQNPPLNRSWEEIKNVSRETLSAGAG